MAMNGFVEDMMYGGLFDNIEDLLDFSTDDEALGMGDSAGGDGSGDGSDGAAKVSSAVTATTSFQTATSDVAKICDEINIHEDWITNFLDDTNFDIDFSAATGAVAAAAPPSSGRDKDDEDDDHSRFRSFSPVSVLDEPNNDNGGSSSSSSSSFSSSSSSTSGSRTHVGPTMMLVPARARSKRPRRAAAAPSHATAPIVPPASEGPLPVPTLLPECESFGESETCALLPPTKKKTKRRNHHHHHQNLLTSVGDAAAVRKCQHCGIQKTPQWRAGPTGPKTLCNACGVRYKSGRLFPEYRPAASPTFVPSIHSNSHKKVVEMRIRACQQKAADGMPSPENPAAKNCDLLAYIRRKRD